MTAQTGDEQGFTLIELLIAIVVMGVLTAVAVVGIGGLVNSGHTAACQATMGAARAASAMYFANAPDPKTTPEDFHDLVSPSKVLDIPSGVTPTEPAQGDVALQGKGWTLTMTPTTPGELPTFACTYPQ